MPGLPNALCDRNRKSRTGGAGAPIQEEKLDGAAKACYAMGGMRPLRFKELLGGSRTVVMLGMCKNAGKTTALCRLIREFSLSDDAPLALTSIGRDGEIRDLVTGTEKPPIYLYEGMLAATARELLPLSDVSREILATTGLYTSLGEVVLFRARSDGFVQLAGPGIVEQLKQLSDMFYGFGAGRILIDGALSRRSPAAAASGGAVVLSSGASLDRDMDTVIAETAFAAELLCLREMTAPEAAETHFTLLRAGGEQEGLEQLSGLVRGEEKEILAVNGAFTESQARQLLLAPAKKDGLTILARDASCLMLRRATYRALTDRGAGFALRQKTKLAAVTVNPVSAGGWSFPGDEFRKRMQAAVNVPVLNVLEEEGDERADI